MPLTKAQILESKDLKREEVQVPEWGGSVIVQALSGKERDAFESSVVELHGKETVMDLRNIRAKLCALSIRGEDGRRMFDDDEVDALGDKSAEALQRVFEVAQRLAGLTPEDVKKLVKNS